MNCRKPQLVASRLQWASYSSSAPVESIPGRAAPFSASTKSRRRPARKARSGPIPEPSRDDDRQPARRLFRSQPLRLQALPRECSPVPCSVLEPPQFASLRRSRVQQPPVRRMQWRWTQRRRKRELELRDRFSRRSQFSHLEFQPEEQLLELEPRPGPVPPPPLGPTPRTGLHLPVSKRQESARRAIPGW